MVDVIIVEDEESIATIVQFALKKENIDADIYHNGLDGYNAIKNGRYKIALLDVMLPGMDGLNIAKKIRNRNKDIYIIMVTAKGDENSKVTGLDVGADDYIAKPFSIKELIARVKVGLRRLNANRVTFDDIVVKEETKEVRIKNTQVPFTKTEFLIFFELYKNKGSYVSRSNILKDALGYENSVQTRTVDVHMKNIKAKTKGLLVFSSKTNLGYKMVGVHDEK